MTHDPGKAAIDAYLRPLYTNDEDQMVCQICRQEMPFKKRNGQPYFERVEAFGLAKECTANYLALCPVCAAKYCEFVVHDCDNARSELMKSLLGVEDPSVAVELGEEKASIQFVERHFADIKDILIALRDSGHD